MGPHPAEIRSRTRPISDTAYTLIPLRDGQGGTGVNLGNPGEIGVELCEAVGSCLWRRNRPPLGYSWQSV